MEASVRLTEMLCSRLGQPTLAAAVEHLTTDFRRYKMRHRKLPGDRRPLKQLPAMTMKDLLATATVNGVRISFINEAPFEGRYERRSDTDEITLRSHTNEKRLLFTLAHELGHVLIARFLDSSDSVHFRSMNDNCDREEEKVADAIAAEILMPTQAFRECITSYGINFSGVRAAQRLFGSTKTAVLRRMADVSRRSVAFLNVVPSHLRDLESLSLIDEAVFAIPGSKPIFCREEVSLISPPRFREIKQLPAVRLQVRSTLLEIPVITLETKYWASPCHNIDLLGTF